MSLFRPTGSKVELTPERIFIDFAWSDYKDFDDFVKLAYKDGLRGLTVVDKLQAFRIIKRQAIHMHVDTLLSNHTVYDEFERFTTISTLRDELSEKYAPEPLTQRVNVGFVAASLLRGQGCIRVFQVGPQA